MNAKRRALLLIATAACALAALLVFRGLRHGRGVEGPSNAPVPVHYFSAAVQDHGPVLECRLTAFEDSLWEIWNRPLQPCLADRGWTGSATWGARSFGASSSITFWLDATDWDRITVRTKAYHGLPKGVEQTLRVELPGHTSEPAVVPREWTDLSFDIPSDALRPGANRVVLRFAHRLSPSEAGLAKDELPVAAAVERISLSRSTRRVATRRDAVRGQVFDRASGRFRIDRSGTLVLPVAVPAGTTELPLEVKGRKIPASKPARVAISLSSIDDDRVVRDAFEIGSPALGGVARPVERRLAAAALSGASCLLTIEVDLADGGTLEVFPPKLEPIVAPAPPAPPAVNRPQRPDIILITLDAARADHLSCYGYSRPTTPFIDGFAAGALRFESAFALAPYTLCSVPTMITGLSFFDHGVTSRDSTLGEPATTLAESLRDAGYRTACFSATPNNTAGKGFDQGYDEFFELWNEAPHAKVRQPHYVTGRVTEWLGTLDDDRPLHLQIHYVPPHGPYTPGKRFDRFTDPSYDRPCGGLFPTLTGLEVGGIDPGNGCLDEVIGLYDGNLLAADDAVGVLLRSLERRARWRDTVVLITADHGEAFLEHGRMHHNSTVFDDMLRVPFILRVPDWIATGEVDVTRVVTLADIVPTLLGTAGIRPVAGLEGVDLLADPGGPLSPRVVIATNTDKPPLLGLRTRRWKAILSPSGQGALFDLERDPGELDNLVFDQGPTFAGLGLLLTQRATQPPSIGASSARAEITDADREMLRALGYVDDAGGD
jgi:arylsulfatase